MWNRVSKHFLGFLEANHHDISRKGLPDIPARLLYVRFVVLSNELPSLEDASGALSSRFSLLRLTESFLGNEDLSLEDKLTRELPGIFLWSIQGWERLKKNGRFTEAESAQMLRDQNEELISPVKTFLREWCILKRDMEIRTDDLFDAWQGWCSMRENIRAGRKAEFGKKLIAARGELTRERPRDGDMRYWKYSGIDLNEDGRAGLDRWRALERERLNR